MSNPTLDVFIPAFKGDDPPGPKGDFIHVYENDTIIGFQFGSGVDSASMDEDNMIDTFVTVEEAEEIIKGIQEAIDIAKRKLNGKATYYKKRMIHI